MPRSPESPGVPRSGDFSRFGSQDRLLQSRWCMYVTLRRVQRHLALLTLAASLGAFPARASDAIPVERMRLAVDRSGPAGVESGTVLPHLALDSSALLGLSDDPLVTYRRDTGEEVAKVVDSRLAAVIGVAVGLLDRAQVGVELPVVLHQQRSTPPGYPGGLPSLSTFGLGDLRFASKVRVPDPTSFGLDVAVLAAVGLPTGRSTGFIGAAGTSFEPGVAVSRPFGPLRAAADLLLVLRSAETFKDARIGSEIAAQAGTALRLDRLVGSPLELSAALAARVSATRPLARSNETSVEARFLASWDLPAREGMQLFGGAGLGLVRGFGTPDTRLFVGLRFARGASPMERAAVPEALAVPSGLHPVGGAGVEDDVEVLPREADGGEEGE